MRVIAGALGGRRLVAPRGEATRPTSDRVREALFSALGEVDGASVLDLYAGTGALGIEALSRGAARAVFVESAKPALVALRDNVAALGLADRTLVVAQPVARAIAALQGPFDLLLVDPPYADVGDVAALVAKVIAQLSPGARLVLEHASRDAAPSLPGLEAAPTRRYGDTAVTFYGLLATQRAGG